MFRVPVPAFSLLLRARPTQQQWPLLTSFLPRSNQTRLIGTACRKHLTPATSSSSRELSANSSSSSSSTFGHRLEQGARDFAAAVAVSGGLLLGLATAMAPAEEANCEVEAASRPSVDTTAQGVCDVPYLH